MINNKQGFNLVELIIAMAIVGILATIFLTVIKPTNVFTLISGTKHDSDLKTIEKAIQEYILKNQTLPASILNLDNSQPYMIIHGQGTYNSPLSCRQIGVLNTTSLAFLVPNYLPSLPVNSIIADASASGTGYYLERENTQVYVGACAAEFDFNKNLVAYWHMDNNWTDSINSNNGTAYGSPTFTSDAKAGGYAGNFDNSDYLVVTSDDVLEITDALTIAAWIKTTDGYGGIVDKQNSSVSGYRLILESNGKVEFGIYGGYGGCGYTELNSPGTVHNGQWHYIIGTYDGTNMIVYIDGVNVANATQTCLYAEVFNLQIARQDSSGYLLGKIDEVAIWNRALPSDEVLALYQSYN